MNVGDVLTSCTSSAYSSPQNPFSRPWCTWYAFGRALENGRNIGVWSGNAGTWPITTTSGPYAGQVASFSDGGAGHVVYIEAVVGNTVYFTEGNGYRGPGVVSSKTITQFKTLWGKNLRGYL